MNAGTIGYHHNFTTLNNLEYATLKSDKSVGSLVKKKKELSDPVHKKE